MSDPITPEEVLHLKERVVIPAAVIDTFNYLIAQAYQNGQATVFQDDVVERLVRLGWSRFEIFDKCYLDIEDIYRARGWLVTYDKPGYNESGRAYFRFAAKSKVE